ncbi:MAG: aminoglycoside 3'-phosphotransferase [Acidobacteriota bacterium]|nr:aminoglycoside 3'-phosphotransferase [Acidobacteriota bacterium]
MLKLPASIAEAISGYKRQRNFTGMATWRVFRLEKANSDTLYLKIAVCADSELHREKLRLEWLDGKLPVPKVKLFDSDGKRDYLLISEIEGFPSSHNCYKAEPEKVIQQLADGLKMIRAVPTDDCPFDAALDKKIEFARFRIEQNLIDETDFDDERQGRNLADLFCEVLTTRPETEDLVFTHGDFCLPNIILKNNRLSGFIDWGRAGVTDRYQDIALLSRSVADNFGEQWQPFLFKTLGVEPDLEKIKFYKLLDEFF